MSGRRAERIRRTAADRRVAGWAGFWWGLAEGVVFFIVPDVWISYATLFSARAGAVAWLASIAGSLVAILVIRGLTAVPGLNYVALLDRVPGISPGMIGRAGEVIAAGGLPFTPLLVLGGVPLKVYGGLALALGLPLGAVVAWTAFARVVRIAPTFLLAGAVRLLFRRSIDARPEAWAVMLAVWWVGFYVVYFARMGRM